MTAIANQRFGSGRSTSSAIANASGRASVTGGLSANQLAYAVIPTARTATRSLGAAGATGTSASPQHSDVPRNAGSSDAWKSSGSIFGTYEIVAPTSDGPISARQRSTPAAERSRSGKSERLADSSFAAYQTTSPKAFESTEALLISAWCADS